MHTPALKVQRQQRCIELRACRGLASSRLILVAMVEATRSHLEQAKAIADAELPLLR